MTNEPDWDMDSFYPEDDDEATDYFFTVFTTMIEHSYILGKIDRAQLVASLRKLHNDDGLDITEAVEGIEQRKEEFYREIIQRVKASLKTK